MSKMHSTGFLNLVNTAKSRIQEISIEEYQAQKQQVILIDVREDREWQSGHLPEAMHLGKGIIERDIEQRVPDRQQKLVLYCGGGYRSALAADALNQMGYRDVSSLIGGYSAWVAAGGEIVQPVSNS